MVVLSLLKNTLGTEPMLTLTAIKAAGRFTHPLSKQERDIEKPAFHRLTDIELPSQHPVCKKRQLNHLISAVLAAPELCIDFGLTQVSVINIATKN